MSRREVVITGVGLCTPMGHRLDELHRSACDGGAVFEALQTRFTSALPAARVTQDLSQGLPRQDVSLGDRTALLAVHAAAQALQQAGLADDGGMRRQMGVYVGCGSGPTEALTIAYGSLFDGQRMHPLSLLRCLPCGPAAMLSLRYGLQGPAITYASACASSGAALGEAMRAIRHGEIDAVLAGGTESPFGSVTLHAWQLLRVLAPVRSIGSAHDDPSAACKPFDRERSGLALGEGAVFFVLEAREHALRRRAMPLATLAGYGASADSHHWTEPSCDGQVRAMQAALHDAGLHARDIGYVNAHGTGTAIGDAVESRSIAEVFGCGDEAPWVSSTKAAHGHLLGAASAIELAVTLAALQSGELPPTRNLSDPDSELSPRLLRGAPGRMPSGRAAVMSNSFAFGGSNACLVLTR